MNVAEIKKLIEEYRDLFWYIPENEKENISQETLVETILNHGDMQAVKKLFKVMGTDKVASIFFDAKGRRICNYYPEVYNFFSLYFKKNVQRNIK